MTDKPDGYVAWHPECGMLISSPSFEVHDCHHNAFQDLQELRMSGLFDDKPIRGWRIRPVKLVFLDEDKPEEAKEE